jgi:hypothetical protein
VKHTKPLITINFILSSPPLSVFLSTEHLLLCGPFCLETWRELLNLNLFNRRFKNLQFSGFHGWLLSYGFLSCNQRAMGTMCAIAAMIFIATREQCGQCVQKVLNTVTKQVCSMLPMLFPCQLLVQTKLSSNSKFPRLLNTCADLYKLICK